MIGRNLLLAAIAAFVSTSTAAQLTLQLSPSNFLPNPNALPASTHATLTSSDGSILRAFLRKDNTIVLPEIQTAGSHLLSIHSRDYAFASYRIDTAAQLPASVDDVRTVAITLAAQTFPGTKWSDVGPNMIPQQPDASSSTGMSTRPQSTLTLSPRVIAQKQFYETRPAFSPLSLLKNPMILMAVVALAFTFGMPKLMENMDPDMRAEYEEMQKKGPTAAIGRAMNGQGPASSTGNGFDLAGYLAGQGKESSAAKPKK